MTAATIIRDLLQHVPDGANDEADAARAKAQAYLAEEEVIAFYAGHGFEILDTGGGCRALLRQIDCGLSILVTEQGEAEIPAEVGSPVTVGLYAEEHGDALAQFDSPDAEAALGKISRGEWT